MNQKVGYCIQEAIKSVLFSYSFLDVFEIQVKTIAWAPWLHDPDSITPFLIIKNKHTSQNTLMSCLEYVSSFGNTAKLSQTLRSDPLWKLGCEQGEGRERGKGGEKEKGSL